MSSKNKEIFYLVMIMPLAVFAFFVYGLFIFILFGDNEPPVPVEYISYAIIVSIFLGNILYLKRFGIRNRFTLIVSNLELLALLIFAAIFF